MRSFLLNLTDDSAASIAPTVTAAAPPYSSNTRNTNVSETEICELKRGIGTVICEASSRAIATRMTKRESNWATLSCVSEYRNARLPAPVTTQRNGPKKRDLMVPGVSDIYHGRARGEGSNAFYQGGSGDEASINSVAWKLLPWEEDGLVRR